MRNHFKLFCFLSALFLVATVNAQSAEFPPYSGQLNVEQTAQLRTAVVGNSESLNYHVFLPTIMQFRLPSGQDQQTIRRAILLSADLTQPTHSISPYIYGANLIGDEAVLQQWQLPINRWGGNALTRYNWRQDVYNPGNHQFYENLLNPDPGTLPNNSTADQFVERNRQYRTASLMQTSIIGWTPTDRSPRCGFQWNKYGEQTNADWYTMWGCGNGISKATNNYVVSDPYDTSVPVDENNSRDWVRHLVSRYGKAQQGGVQFYQLDNEPMLWNLNHRDIHPQAPSYDEVVTKGIRNGSAIKSADPTAKVIGPGLWGWSAYFRSTRDLEDPNGDPDYERTRLDFLPYYLQEMRRFEEQNGYRLLDYLDVHYYAQGYIDGVSIWEDSVSSSPTTNALRMRSTKDLWDRNYRSESWIDQPTYVIPRLKEWIAQYYPGTKLSLSEYRWGGFDTIGGALTQAELLGIFGREDVGMAMVWDAPKLGTPGDYAFRIYRNYDNRGSMFGDLSLRASSSNSDLLSIYAAKRSADGATTLMVINKADFGINSDIALSGAENTTSAQVYQYSSADLATILVRPNLAFANGFANFDFPAHSITLFVLTNSNTPASVVHPIYEDNYSAEWVNWSWNTNADPSQKQIVKNGRQAIQISHNVGWAGYYLHANRDIIFSRNDQLEFWVHGGNGGQNVKLYLVHRNERDNYLEGGAQDSWGKGITVPIVAGGWQKVTVSFDEIAPRDQNLFNGIVMFNTTDNGRWPFYIDDMRHISNP